ncbi:hypothetical protein HQQ80_16335 [Microbacteriaceae bacterium VKM Ac-2855]|nr:hypothetical protein [Microbacteriaceae bacterium VKM Ac-2855]
MTVQGASRLRLGRVLASVLSVAAIAFAGLAVAPSASADLVDIPCSEPGDPITFTDPQLVTGVEDFSLTFSSIDVKPCYDGGIVSIGVAGATGYTTIDSIDVPAGHSDDLTAGPYATESGPISVAYSGQGTLGDDVTLIAGGGTLDGIVDRADCPVDPTVDGIVFDEDAIGYDWSVPGELSVTLPPATAVACADSAFFLVALQTPSTTPGGPSDSPHGIDVAIPATGYAGGVVTLDIPFSAEWEAYVSARVITDAEVSWYHDTPAERRYAYADAFEACVAGLASTPLVVTAAGGAGMIGFSVAPFDVPDCADSATLTVTALAILDEFAPGYEPAVLFTGDAKDFAGIDATVLSEPGSYFVYADLSVTVDGETRATGSASANNGHRITVTEAAGPSPSRPAAVTSTGTRTLASTGSDPLTPIALGSVLLALGSAAMFVARRRRSA